MFENRFSPENRMSNIFRDTRGITQLEMKKVIPFVAAKLNDLETSVEIQFLQGLGELHKEGVELVGSKKAEPVDKYDYLNRVDNVVTRILRSGNETYLRALEKYARMYAFLVEAIGMDELDELRYVGFAQSLRGISKSLEFEILEMQRYNSEERKYETFENEVDDLLKIGSILAESEQVSGGVDYVFNVLERVDDAIEYNGEFRTFMRNLSGDFKDIFKEMRDRDKPENKDFYDKGIKQLDSI